ncbi:MAG: hypothetical protein ACRCYD_01780 [Plesiomonas sp.]
MSKSVQLLRVEVAMGTNPFAGLSSPLTVEQVDFRIQSITKSGWAIILVYKDARVDMDRLDEVVGRGFWQRKHEFKNGILYCSVGLWNKEIGQWVWVEDAGTESNQDKEKGQASDAFKRACFNLGIGRELYEYPTILVELQKHEYEIFTYQGKEKVKQTNKLKLKQWKWKAEFNGNKVAGLSATDEKGQVRFSHGTLRVNGGQRSAPQQQNNAPAQQSQQRAQGNQPGGDDKPWYNTFDDEKEAIRADIQDGRVTPQQVIDQIRSSWKVKRSIAEEILAMGNQ